MQSSVMTMDWLTSLRQGVSQPLELLERLELTPDDFEDPIDFASPFRMRVPLGFIDRMTKGDPNDPLLRQILPVQSERQNREGYTADPVGEVGSANGLKVLHKYRGRVLLIVASACPIHCRYCFRREFPYGQFILGKRNLDEVIRYIQDDLSITEVILSGGDPLSISNADLESLNRLLADIAHVRRLRVHTRFPIVLPERVDSGLVKALTATRLQPTVVLHANHPQEIDASVRAATNLLWREGILLLSQGVMLRGINDDPSVVAELCEALFAAHILPYYMHLMDPIQGGHRFDVPVERAKEVMREVAQLLPGYLVPRLAREVHGYGAKEVLL
jgi:EF-P beta-lysylation protein EpmB